MVAAGAPHTPSARRSAGSEVPGPAQQSQVNSLIQRSEQGNSEQGCEMQQGGAVPSAKAHCNAVASISTSAPRGSLHACHMAAQDKARAVRRIVLGAEHSWRPVCVPLHSPCHRKRRARGREVDALKVAAVDGVDLAGQVQALRGRRGRERQDDAARVAHAVSIACPCPPWQSRPSWTAGWWSVHGQARARVQRPRSQGSCPV